MNGDDASAAANIIFLASVRRFNQAVAGKNGVSFKIAPCKSFALIGVVALYYSTALVNHISVSAIITESLAIFPAGMPPSTGSMQRGSLMLGMHYTVVAVSACYENQPGV